MEKFGMKYMDLYEKLNYCNCTECIKYINFRIEKDRQIDIALVKMKKHKEKYYKMRLLEESSKIIERKAKEKKKEEKQPKKKRKTTNGTHEITNEIKDNENIKDNKSQSMPITIMGFEFTEEIFEYLLLNTNESINKLEKNIEEYLKHLNFDMKDTKEDRELYEYYMKESKINYNIIGNVNIIIYKIDYYKDINTYYLLYNSFIARYTGIESQSNINCKAHFYADTLLETYQKEKVIVVHFGFPFNMNLVITNEKYEAYKLNICLNKYKNGMLKYILNDTNTEKGVIGILKIQELINNIIIKKYIYGSNILTYLRRLMQNYTTVNQDKQQYIFGKDITKINEMIVKIRESIPEDI